MRVEVIEEGHPNGTDLVKGVEAEPTTALPEPSASERRLYADKFKAILKFGDIEALLVARVIFDKGKIRYVRSLALYDLEEQRAIPKVNDGIVDVIDLPERP